MGSHAYGEDKKAAPLGVGDLFIPDKIDQHYKERIARYTSLTLHACLSGSVKWHVHTYTLIKYSNYYMPVIAKYGDFCNPLPGCTFGLSDLINHSWETDGDHRTDDWWAKTYVMHEFDVQHVLDALW